MAQVGLVMQHKAVLVALHPQILLELQVPPVKEMQAGWV
jgi:hypothetical protein